MYEADAEFSVKTGAAFLCSNLSVLWHEPRALTYVAFLGKNVVKINSYFQTTYSNSRLFQIQLLSYNEKMEQQSCDLLTGKECGGGGGNGALLSGAPEAAAAESAAKKPSAPTGVLMQVKLCLPLSRVNPLAVVLSTTNVVVGRRLFLKMSIVVYSI